MYTNLGIVFFLILFGILSGMVVNYLADVLPWKRRFVRPFCTGCEIAQPLINYFFAPRRCPNCTTPRSWRTWVVELVYVGLAIWTWGNPASKLNFWFGWMILVFFGVVVVIDLEHRLILHPVSLIGALLGFSIGYLRNGWLDTLVGGVVGYIVVLLIYWLGGVIMNGLARLRGQTLDGVAFGYGDVNLSGLLGLMLGGRLIIPALVLAVFIGGIVSLVYIVYKLLVKEYKPYMALPYGPFLICGAFIILFLGECLLSSLVH